MQAIEKANTNERVDLYRTESPLSAQGPGKLIAFPKRDGSESIPQEFTDYAKLGFELVSAIDANLAQMIKDKAPTDDVRAYRDATTGTARELLDGFREALAATQTALTDEENKLVSVEPLAKGDVAGHLRDAEWRQRIGAMSEAQWNGLIAEALRPGGNRSGLYAVSRSELASVDPRVRQAQEVVERLHRDDHADKLRTIRRRRDGVAWGAAHHDALRRVLGEWAN